MKGSTRSSLEEQTPSSILAYTQFCESFAESRGQEAELKRDGGLRDKVVDCFADNAATTHATDRDNMQVNVTEQEVRGAGTCLVQVPETASDDFCDRVSVEQTHLENCRDDIGSRHEPGSQQGNRFENTPVDSVDSQRDFCFPVPVDDEEPMVVTALKRIGAALLREECKTSKALFERVMGFESVRYEESMSSSPGVALDPAEVLYAYLHNLCMFFVRARHPQTVQVKHLAECLLQKYQSMAETEKLGDSDQESAKSAEHSVNSY